MYTIKLDEIEVILNESQNQIFKLETNTYSSKE